MARPRLTLDMKGVDKAIKQFEILAKKKKKETKEIVNQKAIDIQRGAKKRAPVDDGTLRSSIVLEPFKDGLAIRVGSRLPYAAYQEWGTGIYAQHPDIPGRKTPWTFKHPKTGEWWVNFRGAKPQPFLFPAFEAEKDDFLKKLEELYKKL
ncbi:HK97-gp10 family putative phage morphogenesis protein [Aeribacillus pallidus]|uniref:HK97-gp10 family putative phage morphogenesis protein n=1 Tax=Aeribacillus pallidus TaxID=33936 RepID=UPI003D224053